MPTICAGGRHNMPPVPCKLTFDLLTLKVVSESRVMWATCVPILVFLGLSVLDLGPIYATDIRQTRIIAQCLRPMGARHNNLRLSQNSASKVAEAIQRPDGASSLESLKRLQRSNQIVDSYQSTWRQLSETPVDDFQPRLSPIPHKITGPLF